tara:strand:+ start:2675 stop:3346 length:672 start_codon:yes stop_codon:yes gene_type:complete
MADYPLSLTGSEIDSALGKVHNADSSPAQGSFDMVTSGGVFTAINDLDATNFAASALITESDGIANNDNDSTIPTSAAVKDFVTTSGPQVAQLTAPDGNTVGFTDLTIPFVVSSDPSGMVSASNGVATPSSSGIYQVAVEGEFFENDGDTSDAYVLKLFLGTKFLATSLSPINETGANTFVFRSVVSFVNADNTEGFSGVLERSGGNTNASYRNTKMTIVKIA